MSLKKRLTSLVVCTTLVLGSINFAFADGTRVVTLGANLNEKQRETILKYFGVNENEVVILEVNNQEERKYLEGVATEAQLGKKTFSCAYVEPTKKGSGINVKIANLTWLTSSMVASTLTTTGMTDADVVVASVFPVSGTGALTGIMKAFEDATGKELDEDKKELASEELIITGDLGDEIGADKATAIINDIKTEIIKNNTNDTVQIAETINNVTNNYNVTLNINQQNQIQDLMAKVAKQDYNYNEMKETLKGIKNTIKDKLEAIGEAPSTGFFEKIKEWFAGIGEWFANLFNNSKNDLGILENTNDSILGENVVIDATSEEAINITLNEDTKSENIFTKIWNWFTGLFNNSNKETDNKYNETDSSGNEVNEDNQLEEITSEEEHFDTNEIKDTVEEDSTNTDNTDVIPDGEPSDTTQDNTIEDQSINKETTENIDDTTENTL